MEESLYKANLKFRCPRPVYRYDAGLDLTLAEYPVNQDKIWLYIHKYNFLKYRAHVKEDDRLINKALKYRDVIVAHNTKLVIYFVSKNSYLKLEDFNSTLMNCVEKFNPFAGTQFSTYCYWALINYANHKKALNKRIKTVSIDKILDPADYDEEPSDLDIIFNKLSADEESILRNKFGIWTNGKSLHELGREQGCSQEWVRRKIDVILKRLRRDLKPL